MSKEEQRLTGGIALTKLVHVVLDKKGKGGKKVRGLFIPIEQNMLIVGAEKDGNSPVYMNIALNLKPEKDSHGNNGFITKGIDIKANFDGKTWKELSDEDKEKVKELTPILGNVKIWERNGGSTAADNSGNAGGGEVFEDDDDLPF